MKINLQQFIEKLNLVNIIVHVMTIALSILYFLNPTPALLFDFFGLLLLISWILNFTLLLITDTKSDKSTEIGKKINRHSYYFIMSFIVAILHLIFGIIFKAFILSGFLAFLGNLMVISGFLIIILYGFYYNLLINSTINIKKVWKNE